MKATNVIRLLCLLFLLAFSVSIYADRSAMDDEIVEAIQSQIILDDDLANSDIDVTCHNGIVQLEGEVSSIELKNRIIDIVQSTDGVAKIDGSQLIVNPY